ncbi:MAG TPA: 50S ribosomal protein L13 [Candidatus Acetothermia bacterium]|jgi:large subunit ribosomal protein L13|nr:50S ribosomal protein L13 [Candidatus Bipolaricaulota bacterium]HDJ29519.1 50S ribosomal protein L13 [Candidatus Acetothermia bacterium]
MQRTYVAKNEERGKTWERNWYLVNADGKTLGRLASEIAVILQGKHKPIYTPHVDTGDYVIVINAEKVVLTGNKWDQKLYQRHSGYIGGLKEIPYRKLIERRPTLPVREAVRRMLPKTTLGRRMLRKLKVYAGPTHPHTAQRPIELSL